MSGDYERLDRDVPSPGRVGGPHAHDLRPFYGPYLGRASGVGPCAIHSTSGKNNSRNFAITEF
jgi:hypothetical protein